MNIHYIKEIIKDLNEVLTSKTSDLSESDFNKLSHAKSELENKLTKQDEREITIEDKANYIQIVILIIEIIKNVSDHWK